MRQFVIDEITKEEKDAIEDYLRKTLEAAAMPGIYWLRLPDDLPGPAQEGHGECEPFYFGIELTDRKVVFELLIRNQSSLHCSCIAHATKAQRDFLLQYIDVMLKELQIRA